MNHQVETTVSDILSEMNDSNIFEMICLMIKNEDFDIKKYNNGDYSVDKIAETYKTNRDRKDITLESWDEIDIDAVFEDLSRWEKNNFIDNLKNSGYINDESETMIEGDNPSSLEFNRSVLSLVGCRRYISKQKEQELIEFINNIYN